MITLSSLFSDGMILQRDQPVAVWGKTDPNTIVECELDGIKARTGSSYDGKFFLRLPPHSVGYNAVMTVTNLESKETIRRQNIAFGEVFLAAGQSNMAFALASSPEQYEEFRKLEFPAEALRVFPVERRMKATMEDFTGGEWLSVVPENIPRFPAVCAWFMYRLHRELKVPIGIINASVGGTGIEAWTNRNTLINNPDYRETMLQYDAVLNTPQRWSSVKMTEVPPSFQELLKTPVYRMGQIWGLAKAGLNLNLTTQPGQCFLCPDSGPKEVSQEMAPYGFAVK